MLSTWLDFGGILLETLFFVKFSLKISDVFFQGQTLYWTYLRNGWSDWCETKRRCIGWILGELCDLHHWPHPWPWPCSFKVKVWNRLIWGMGWGVGCVIDMDRKGCESIIHDHDCDLWVTMVGWVDVPYSDWGDFKRQRAVNISSWVFGVTLLVSRKSCWKYSQVVGNLRCHDTHVMSLQYRIAMNITSSLCFSMMWTWANSLLWGFSCLYIAGNYIMTWTAVIGLYIMMTSYEGTFQITHWGRVTHICVNKLTIIGSDNGLSPGWRQAIIWTNAEILLIGPLGTNFSEILIEIKTFLAATKQLNEWYFLSVCPSVRLSHLFDYVPIIVSSWNFQELSLGTRVRSMQKVKVRGQRSRSKRSRPNLTVSGL